MDTNISNIYKDYPIEVQQYMQNVVDCLEQDYGKIPASWRISLDLIADNVKLYMECKKQIEDEGLVRKDPAHGTFKHPLIPVMNNAQSQLKDLLKAFSLTPMSKAKMKSLKDSDQINTNEYLDDLMN